MTIVFLGIAFVVLAILNWFGLPYVVSTKFRDKPWRQQFQRGLAAAYGILGITWGILGFLNRDTAVQNSTEFCIKLLLGALIPAIILVWNKKRFGI